MLAVRGSYSVGKECLLMVHQNVRLPRAHFVLLFTILGACCVAPVQAKLVGRAILSVKHNGFDIFSMQSRFWTPGAPDASRCLPRSLPNGYQMPPICPKDASSISRCLPDRNPWCLPPCCLLHDSSFMIPSPWFLLHDCSFTIPSPSFMIVPSWFLLLDFSLQYLFLD